MRIGAMSRSNAIRKFTQIVFTLIIAFGFASLTFTQEARPQVSGVLNFGKVTDRYFRGGEITPEGVGNLSKMGVRTIIDLRDDDSPGEAEACKANGIKYFKFRMSGHATPSDSAVKEILSLIENAKEPVYVHCSGGKHRAGTIAALYRMRVQGWSKEHTWAEQQSYGFGLPEEHPDLYAYAYGKPESASEVGRLPEFSTAPAAVQIAETKSSAALKDVDATRDTPAVKNDDDDESEDDDDDEDKDKASKKEMRAAKKAAKEAEKLARKEEKKQLKATKADDDDEDDDEDKPKSKKEDDDDDDKDDDDELSAKKDDDDDDDDEDKDDEDNDDDDAKSAEKKDEKVAKKDKVKSDSQRVVLMSTAFAKSTTREPVNVETKDEAPTVATSSLNSLSPAGRYMPVAEAIKHARSQGGTGDILKIDLEWDPVRKLATWDVTFSSGDEYELDSTDGKLLAKKNKAGAKLNVLTPLKVEGESTMKMLSFEQIILAAETARKQRVLEMELKQVKGRNEALFEVAFEDGVTQNFDASTGKLIPGI